MQISVRRMGWLFSVGLLSLGIMIGSRSAAAESGAQDAPNQCVAAGTGNSIGQLIGDWTFTNCLGKQVRLHEGCGRTKALWIMSVAAWCGACTEQVPIAAELQRRYASEGLDLMVLLNENEYNGVPTTRQCINYAKTHGIDPSRVYVVSWPMVNSMFSACYSPYLPWNAVLSGENMQYVHSDSCTPHSNVHKAIQRFIPSYQP